MPSRRQAVLTISGPEDQTITYLAEFDRLTLTRTQEGGYRREPDGARAGFRRGDEGAFSGQPTLRL